MRRVVMWIGVVIVAALIYDGVDFLFALERKSSGGEEEAQQETDQARKTVDALGGGGLKILSFYAAPGTIRRGEHTSLCYGVTGAKTVRMEPPGARGLAGIDSMRAGFAAEKHRI